MALGHVQAGTTTREKMLVALTTTLAESDYTGAENTPTQTRAHLSFQSDEILLSLWIEADYDAARCPGLHLGVNDWQAPLHRLQHLHNMTTYVDLSV